MTNTLHIYTRVSSTIQQEEGTSLENQKQLGIRKSQELGFDFRLWNEGGQSSFFDDLNNRPVLVSLLGMIETGVVKHLFVYNTDRLSRNQQTWAVIRYKLLQYGVTLHTVTGQMKLKNPVDDLMLGILSEISQYDNRIRSERSRMGKFQKIQQGNWKGGPPPFGYRLENKQLVTDDFESGWVRKMYDWYCLGISVKSIQQRLGVNGVMTRRGNHHWSLGSIALILRNPVYAGYFDYTDKMFGETVRISTPVIIEPQQFEAAQTKRMKSGSRNQQINPTKHFYLLRGLLVCGHCGTTMGGRINTKGHQNVYYCVKNERKWVSRSDDHPKWKRGCDCSMTRSINIARTDQLVWSMVMPVIRSLWERHDGITCDLSNSTVTLDDCDQLPSDEMNVESLAHGNDAIECEGGRIIPMSDPLVEHGTSERYDLDRQFPNTFSIRHLMTASEDGNAVIPQHQKAVITELVNKITVTFDHPTGKHRVDVEFNSSVQAALRQLPDISPLSPEPQRNRGGDGECGSDMEGAGVCQLAG